MLTTGFYCYNCQVRRQVNWAPIATCSVCGCTVVDLIPSVEEDDDDDDDDDDESETEEIFIYHSNEAEDDLDTEERDLLAHLLSTYDSSALSTHQSSSLRTSVESRDRVIDEINTSLASPEDFLSSLYDRIRTSESHQGQSLLTILGFSSTANNSRFERQYENMMSSLKTIRLAANHPDINEECIICQEYFSSSLDLCVLPCEHKYHSDCIVRWLHVNSSCPICRSAVNEQTNDAQTESMDQINRGISRQS
ncbi:hypothetical protein BD560DRAFT_392760 [Blakeslea trispora]|nr:hypothetical protein BD560DRAFT_392760 [Blakeslea trispora]